ncbi:MAG TPA: hypothetical protein VHP83_07920 [Aggregatilineaceae bacterium]|nr:hypothetical protein [Aggregatilineaceae bacterium]
MPYYPETTIIQGLARIQRERRLPPTAEPRPTHTIQGAPVDPIHVVLEGDLLKDFRILDVAKLLNIRDPEFASTVITAQVGRVQVGQELARRGKGRRAKVVQSPADGVIVGIEGSRIIMQVAERSIEILARIQGEIISAEPHVVKMTGNGALIQCAWGNGGFCYEAYRWLPEEGFAGLSKLDVRISEFRNVVIVTPQPINKGDLLVAQQQEVAGVVAPSMPANLREFVMQLKFPVLLTEGFGSRRPTGLIYTLLQSNMGRQAAFDAVVPDRWSWERPEIMIPLPSGGVLPPTPVLDKALDLGSQVRITRAPWDGLIGEIVDFPAAPQVVGSGLRLPSAKIMLSNGQAVMVPLANLELLG